MPYCIWSILSDRVQRARMKAPLSDVDCGKTGSLKELDEFHVRGNKTAA
jgi:hypothetical protein